MRTIEREIVSALIFSNDNKLLMGKKDPDKGGVYPDCWHIPGGGVDEGETLEDTLRREVMEEVGIDISGYEFELVSDKGRGETEKTLKDTGEKVWCKMKFNVYKITISNKNADEIELNLSDDLVEIKWFELSELKNVKQVPAGEELFKQLGYK